MVEKGITLFFLLFSIMYFSLACNLKFGTLLSPKTGFLPMVAGSMAVLLSLLLFLKVIRQEKNHKQSDINWQKFIFTLLGLFLYVVLLKEIGYLGATFLVLIYLFKITDTSGWLIPIIIAAGGAFLSYLIFVQYLGIHWL